MMLLAMDNINQSTLIATMSLLPTILLKVHKLVKVLFSHTLLVINWTLITLVEILQVVAQSDLCSTNFKVSSVLVHQKWSVMPIK